MKISELIYLVLAVVFGLLSIYLFIVTQTQSKKIKELEGKAEEGLTVTIPKIQLS